jgi:hypothetical protein
MLVLGPQPAGSGPRDLLYLFCTCLEAIERFWRFWQFEFRRNPSNQAMFSIPVKFDSRRLHHLLTRFGSIT